MTLHEAIIRILSDNKHGLTPAQMAECVNSRGLYKRKDGKPVPANQIYARINNYPQYFVLKDGLVHLKFDADEKIQNEVQSLLSSTRSLRLPNTEVLIPLLFFFYRYSRDSQHAFFGNLSFQTLCNLAGGEQSRYLTIALTYLKKHPDFNEFDADFLNSINDQDVSHGADLESLIRNINSTAGRIERNQFTDFFSALILSFSGIDGSFATSKKLSRYIRSITDIRDGQSICDPFAGSGTLMSVILQDRLLTGGRYVLGELLQKSAFLGRMNLIVNGVASARYYCLDSVKEYTKLGTNFDWVITEPPLGVKFDKQYLSDVEYLKFDVGYRTDNVMLQLVLALLSSKGKAVIVIGEGFLFSTDLNTVALRSSLLENDWIEAVHSLPSGINPRTSAKLSLLILNKEKANEQKGKVCFREITKADLDHPVATRRSSVMEDQHLYGNVTVEISASEILRNNSLLNANRYLAKEETGKYFTPLTNLARFKSGTNLPKSNIQGRPGLPYVRVTDLVSSGGNVNLKLSAIEQFAAEEAVPLQYQLRGPCILVAKVGKELKATYVNDKSPFVINSNIVAMFPKSSETNLEFITAQLHEPYMDRQLERIRGGAVTPFVRTDDLAGLRIWYPSAEEQHRFLVDFYKKKGDKPEKGEKLLSTLKHEFSNLKEIIDTDQVILKSFLDRKENLVQPFSWSEPVSSMQGARSVKKVFENTQSVLQNMSKLLQDVQVLITLNSRSLRKKPTSIYGMISQQKKLLESQLSGVGFEFLGEIEEALVNIDADLFSLVIRNFLLNSVKHGFSESDDFKFVAFDFHGSEDGLWGELNMMNNGKPLPPDFTIEDFASFGGKTGESAGSGIGGYLMKEITELHGGKLSIPDEFYEKGLFWFPISLNDDGSVKQDFTFIPSVVFRISLPIE